MRIRIKNKNKTERVAMLLHSYSGFMDALLAENKHEFLYGSFRKIDLVRFNKYRHNITAIKGMVPSHQDIYLFLTMLLKWQLNKIRHWNNTMKDPITL